MFMQIMPRLDFGFTGYNLAGLMIGLIVALLVFFPASLILIRWANQDEKLRTNRLACAIVVIGAAVTLILGLAALVIYENIP